MTELPRPIVAEGRIMRAEEDRLGIMFLDVTDEETKLLERFLESQGQARPV